MKYIKALISAFLIVPGIVPVHSIYASDGVDPTAEVQEQMNETADTDSEASVKTVMHRLYNPNSGEHFYTASLQEKNHLVSLGWKYEGEGWTAPDRSETPVYRLYNPVAGEHHYTMGLGERDYLVNLGWKYEGIGWYSDDAKGVPLYRQYNPNARTGCHNYTTSKGENDNLVKLGWRAEGIGWFGMKSSSTDKPAVDPTEYWNKFLKNREFKSDTKTTSGLQYAIVNLNQDSIPELILFRAEEGTAFGWHWLYTFDGTKANLIDSGYGYSCYMWNPQRKQIVLPSETKPFYGAAVYPFATVNTYGLSNQTTLLFDSGTWTLDGKVISETQAKSMLAGNESLLYKLKKLN